MRNIFKELKFQFVWIWLFIIDLFIAILMFEVLLVPISVTIPSFLSRQ